MNKWKIKIDEQEIECSLPNGRPSVNIEEIAQEDGSFKLGACVWEPLKIGVKDTWNRWLGEKDVDLILCDESGKQLESWTLKDAKIKSSFDPESVYFSFQNVQYHNFCEGTSCH